MVVLFWLGILVALFMGLGIAVLMGFLFQQRGRRYGMTFPRSSLVWLFLILFLAAWAAGTWMDPTGPQIYGIYWLPYFWGAFFIGLLLFFVLNYIPNPPAWRYFWGGGQGHPQQQQRPVVIVDVFFWFLLIGILIMMVWGYTRF